MRGRSAHWMSWIPLAAAAAASWSTALFVHEHWFGVDEFVETAVVLAAVVVGWRRLRSPNGTRAHLPSPAWLLVGTIALAAFVAVSHSVPRLIGHAILVFGLAATLVASLDAPSRNRAWALLVLPILALPIVPSLQYVVGFPLRLASAWVASLWLGPGIEAVGTGLTDGVHTVFVDGPCSGIRMLWTSTFLAASCALLARFTPLRTGLFLGFALAIAVLGNAIRTVALFVLETRVGTSEGHDAVGIIVFVAVAAGIVLASRRWATPPSTEPREAAPPRVEGSTGLRRSAIALHLAVALVAGVIPFVRDGGRAEAGSAELSASRAPAWPTTWAGIPLIPVSASATLGRFADRFPGACAEFYWGSSSRRMLFRWTPKPTRHLHEAATCFRGLGARVEPRPPLRDAEGHRWTRFVATLPDGNVVAVRQCYFLLPTEAMGTSLEPSLRDAHSWPDASSWYWATSTPGAVSGETIAITVSERVGDPAQLARRTTPRAGRKTP